LTRRDFSFVSLPSSLTLSSLLFTFPRSQLPLFDAFAADESPHVRQSACLALPALAKRLSPPSFRRAHALKAMNGFFNDEFIEIHSTALEVLGELIAVFVDDPEGAPPDLVRHFLGPPKEERMEEVEQPTLNLFASGPPIITMEDNRPLVCAFNVSSSLSFVVLFSIS